MRYMMIMRSTPRAEQAAADVPFEEILAAMGRYNEQLIDAGVLLGAEGLAGPDEGFVVDFDTDPPGTTDGPYPQASELFNGFWILDVASTGEAKQWAQKCPLGPGVRLEVRRVGEIDDFPSDNEWVRKERHWKVEVLERQARLAREAAQR